MRAEAARADRFKAVRDAARAWRRTGAIDDTALAAVSAAYPDDRRRLGPALRALAFVFTSLGLAALFFSLALTLQLDRDGWAFCLGYGALLVAATEWQLGPLRRSDGGTESGTALVSLGFVLGGLLWLLDRAGVQGRSFETLAWGSALLVFAAAFARWGMEICAVLAAVGLFGLLTTLPEPRSLFVLAAVPLLAAALLGEVSPLLAPSQRRGAVGVQAVAVAALYVAVHLGSWDRRIIERPIEEPLPSLRPLFAAATAVLPVLLIALALRLRRRPLLAFGVVCLVASLVTLRFYVHLAPLWVVLTAGGVVAAALALLLERWLGRGGGRQRGGYTADPLFDDERRLRAMEIAVAAGQAGPAARRPAAPAFEGGGGKFGGGGATGSY
jgi:uncharacterized membrane protein YgcG